ncbi:MAG: tetratricopeptide repeat protein [Acidobacteriota bacterium]
MDDRYLDHSYQLAGRTIDPVAGAVEYKGQRSPLSRKQIEVLAVLVSANQPVSREEFILRVWDGNRLVGERGLTNTIYGLRRSLQDSDAEQPLIRTIPRRGYQLHAEAQLAQAAPEAPFAEGAPIPGKPGWRFQRLISRSESVESWRAVHESTRELRTFRFGRSDQSLPQLQGEVEILRRLKQELPDAGVVAGLIDSQLDEPPYRLEMEATVHGSLPEWAALRGGLRSIPLAVRLRLLADAASALHGLHGLGVVHRDIKPASLLIDEQGGRPVVKLGEFSLSRGEPRAAAEDTRDDAPETADDVYTFGVLLFQVVLGDWHRELSPEVLETVDSADLRELIARCTAPHALKRPTAEAIRQQLLTAAAATEAEEARSLEEGPKTSRLDFTRGEPGRSIGPYRLLEVLGEGGMGTVYLANQRHPIERQVALKLIKGGMDSAHVLARFDAERQALALMDHDNVAAVYDAGSSAGRPYFVMEFVPGLELISHCDHSRLGLRERIKLFLQVCHGVHHAHQKGLIHRDLKPSNILVRKHASQPATVKIIDFGVAKSLQRKLSASTVHTRIGTFVGTPRYSSPEQISNHRPDVDTRADVYSLGVVLYELVTGVTPRTSDELAGKSSGELAKILEKDPPPPHSRFSRLDPKKQAEIANSRSESIADLRQRLHADLSWIILKCLERDPEDRYSTVLELKQDLLRWLERKPIEARPSTGFYRAAKFLKRHRAATATAALVVTALLTTTTAAVLGFLRAEREVVKARAAAEEAELAADFQTEQLRELDPAAMGSALRAGELEAIRRGLGAEGLGPTEIEAELERFEDLLRHLNFTDLSLSLLDEHLFKRAEAAIEDKYVKTPRLQARLWQSVASTRQKLGQYESAVAPQEKALEMRRRELGPEHPQTLDSLRKRGRLWLDMGRLNDAEADLRRAEEMHRRILGIEDLQTLYALSDLGSVLRLKGQLEEAEPYYREALEVGRRVLDERHRAVQTFADNLGILLTRRGQLEEAEALHRRVLEIRREILGDDHPGTLSSLNNLGSLLSKRGQLEEAEAVLREAVELHRQIFGNRHRSTLIAINNHGSLLRKQGRFEEAESCLREALETGRQVLGSRHTDTLIWAVNLGNLLHHRGRLDGAKDLYAEVLEARRGLLGDEHGQTLLAMNTLGLLLWDRGELGEAEPLFREAVDVGRRAFGRENPKTLALASNLGGVLRDLDRHGEAEEHLQHTLDIKRRELGDEHPSTLVSTKNFSSLLLKTSRTSEALFLLEEALPTAGRVLGESSPVTAELRSLLGEALLGLGDYQQSERHLLQAHRELDAALPPGRAATRRASAERIRALYRAWGKPDRAPEFRAGEAAFPASTAALN